MPIAFCADIQPTFPRGSKVQKIVAAGPTFAVNAGQSIKWHKVADEMKWMEAVRQSWFGLLNKSTRRQTNPDNKAHLQSNPVGQAVAHACPMATDYPTFARFLLRVPFMWPDVAADTAGAPDSQFLALLSQSFQVLSIFAYVTHTFICLTDFLRTLFTCN